ncbi:MAG: hypothetical protein NTV97_27735 [Alphaproteobacteria bacterium]|nr:hypothetical protein [Alphaproteobacteria bacterium]
MATEPTHAAGLPTVRGLYELGHVLHVLDAGVDGFSRSDIERVECFWDFGDMHHSEAGFVLGLRDGRRVYVDFRHWHGFEQDEDFRIEIEFLSDGQAYPGFSSPHEPVGGWSFDTAHLGKVLAR